MKRRRLEIAQHGEIADAIADGFDDLPDAAFFGVMDELGIDLSSSADDDRIARPRKREKGGRERNR